MGAYLPIFGQTLAQLATQDIAREQYVSRGTRSLIIENVTPYFFQVTDAQGQVLMLIAPFSQGQDNYETVTPEINVSSRRDLPTMTSTNIQSTAWAFLVKETHEVLPPRYQPLSVGQIAAQVTVGAPLPAGTNDIGKVDQGNPNAGGANAWPMVLTGSNAQNVLVNVANVAAGQSTAAPGAGTVLTLGKYTKAIALTASVTYGAAITAAPTVNVYTSPDGVAWDTDPFASFSPSYAINSTKQKTVLLDFGTGAVAKIAVQVVNNDGANALGAVKVTEQEED